MTEIQKKSKPFQIDLVAFLFKYDSKKRDDFLIPLSPRDASQKYLDGARPRSASPWR